MIRPVVVRDTLVKSSMVISRLRYIEDIVVIAVLRVKELSYLYLMKLHDAFLDECCVTYLGEIVSIKCLPSMSRIAHDYDPIGDVSQINIIAFFGISSPGATYYSS